MSPPRRVCGDESVLHCVLQGLVEQQVHVVHGLRGKRPVTPHAAAPLEVGVEPLDPGPAEGSKRHAADPQTGTAQVALDEDRVAVARGRAKVRPRLQPRCEVVLQGLVRGRGVGTVAEQLRDSPELLLGRLLRREPGANGLPPLRCPFRVGVDVEAPACEPRRSAPTAGLSASPPERAARASLGDTPLLISLTFPSPPDCQAPGVGVELDRGAVSGGIDQRSTECLRRLRP